MSKTTNRIAAQTREVLADRFPLCFMPKGHRKRPLKIGIKQEIAQACPDLKIVYIGLALADYCGGPTYLSAMKTGAFRIDLAGLACGIVSEEHHQHAKERMDRLAAKWDAEAAE